MGLFFFMYTHTSRLVLFFNADASRLFFHFTIEIPRACVVPSEPVCAISSKWTLNGNQANAI